MLKAPAFLFPTYTAFIDDDVLYPKIITSDIANCPLIASGSDFAFVLKQKHKDFLFLNHPQMSTDEILTTISDDVKNKTTSLLDLISVLIVDLNMEGSNGLDILRQIKSPFVYKVLVSNYIDTKNDDAVKSAQNAGIIHEVLEKGRHLVTALPKTIRRGQNFFFTQLSNSLFAGKDSHQYLADTNVANKFLDLLNRFDTDLIWPEADLASFTFSKKETSPSTVFFTTQSEIDALIAGYDLVQIPAQTLKRIQHGDYIVCHKNPHSLDIDEWPYFLRPSHKIAGTNGDVLYQITSDGEIASS